MSPSLSSPTDWRAALAWRARRLFLLKLAGTTAWISVFFVGYFHLLRHPAHAVLQMPLNALDEMIPFQPSMLAPYLTLWLYVGVAPGLQASLRELLAYGAWTAALCVTGLGIFWMWPTAVPPPGLDVATYAGFAMLQGVDATGNACPSMHVAFAVFTGVWVGHLLRTVGAPTWLQLVNLVWMALITWSTLAIKQHVVLDAVAGILLGLLFALASLAWRPRDMPHGAPVHDPAMIDRISADTAS